MNSFETVVRNFILTILYEAAKDALWKGRDRDLLCCDAMTQLQQAYQDGSANEGQSS